MESHEEHARKAEREEASNEARLEAEQAKSEGKPQSKSHGKMGKLRPASETLEVIHEPPLMTPTSSTMTSPSIYQHVYGVSEPQISHSGPQFQASLTPYSPQSMTSFHSTSAPSPFHEIHPHMAQHAMMLGSQSTFHAPSVDHSQEQMTQEHMAALMSATRVDSVASWPSHVHTSTNPYDSHVTSFGSDSDHTHPLHGLPIGQVGFPSSLYDPQPQDPYFQHMDQVDPRDWGFRQVLE